jgi:hypothetical protein
MNVSVLFRKIAIQFGRTVEYIFHGIEFTQKVFLGFFFFKGNGRFQDLCLYVFQSIIYHTESTGGINQIVYVEASSNQ